VVGDICAGVKKEVETRALIKVLHGAKRHTTQECGGCLLLEPPLKSHIAW